MAVTANSYITPQTPNVGVAQITNATTTTAQVVFTAGANGSKLTALLASSTDTSNQYVQVNLVRAATTYILTVTPVPLASGTSATGAVANVNLLALATMVGLPVDNDGQAYLLLKSGDTVAVAPITTITAAKTISVVAVGADF